MKRVEFVEFFICSSFLFLLCFPFGRMLGHSMPELAFQQKLKDATATSTSAKV